MTHQISSTEGLVLSAERVQTGVRRRVRERVRVHREVVVEEVTVTVQVRREVLRVEHEAVGAAGEEHDDGGPASSGELPLEVVLSEERPVVSLEVVPYERVRVGVREVASQTWVATSRAHEELDVAVQPAVAQTPGRGAGTG